MDKADLDYASWPLWHGSLRASIDDRFAGQILYHLLSAVNCSNDVSDSLKQCRLTKEFIAEANKPHVVANYESATEMTLK